MPDIHDATRPGAAARAFAGAGAVLFGVSLTAFAWFYFTGLAARMPRLAPAAAIALDTSLLLLFAAHHSVFARSRARAWVARVVSPRIERATYVWVASLLLLVLCWRWAPFGEPLWDARGAFRYALRGVQALGVALSLAAASVLGARALAGLLQVDRPLPAVGYEPVDAPPRDTGLYAVVRHPIYLGWLLIVWAAPTMTPSHLLFAGLSTAYLLIAIVFEERDLRARFGVAYTDYARHVPHRLVPWIY